MISGKFESMNGLQFLAKVYNMPKGKLGKIFVKYGDAIDMHDYIRQNSSQSFEKMSYNLTLDLYSYHENT